MIAESASRSVLLASLGSRSVARPRISKATPSAIIEWLHCRSATGDTTWRTGLPASPGFSAACTSSSCAMFAAVSTSATVLPSGAVNNTTMFSPPNSSWYSRLSFAT